MVNYWNGVFYLFMVCDTNGKREKRPITTKKGEVKNMEAYEKPTMTVTYLNNEDVLTESQETMFPGDGWVNDPFTNN